MSKSKPEKVFRIGAISASIFVNKVGEGDSQRSVRNVSVQRNFKADDGNWKSTNSFGLAELSQLKQIVELAAEYVTSMEADATPA